MLSVLAASTVFWGCEQPKCWGCSRKLSTEQTQCNTPLPPASCHLLFLRSEIKWRVSIYGFYGKVLSFPVIRAGSDSSRVDTILKVLNIVQELKQCAVLQ